MRWLARWARRMADRIDPPTEEPLRKVGAELYAYAFRTPPGQFRAGIEDAADYVYWIACGRPERTPHVRHNPVGDGRHSLDEGADLPSASVHREVIAAVMPTGQPYCVVCQKDHAPPLHYHTL